VSLTAKGLVETPCPIFPSIALRLTSVCHRVTVRQATTESIPPVSARFQRSVRGDLGGVDLKRQAAIVQPHRNAAPGSSPSWQSVPDARQSQP